MKFQENAKSRGNLYAHQISIIHYTLCLSSFMFFVKIQLTRIVNISSIDRESFFLRKFRIRKLHETIVLIAL